MCDKDIFIKLKEIGCCNACCLRYLCVKNPSAYEDPDAAIEKYKTPSDLEKKQQTEDNNELEETECKKIKLGSCIACLGILQKETLNETLAKVKEAFEKKSYDCNKFALGLSPPVCLHLRGKAIALYLDKLYPIRPNSTAQSIKEAWKYAFGSEMEKVINKHLDSGHHSDLIVTVFYQYDDDRQELESLEQIIPTKYYQDFRRRDFFSRNNVDKLLLDLTLEDIVKGFPCPPLMSDKFVKCGNVEMWRSSVYLGGRYIKLSRELSQTPWVIEGVLARKSSVQDIIFEPLAKLLRIDPEEMNKKMKFLSAGREDVDVRCLGTGRPFAVEITDPQFTVFTAEQFEECCKEISNSGIVIVPYMRFVQRDELTHLKSGEETKTKTYTALCIKLSPGKSVSDNTQNGATEQVKVTSEDLEAIKNVKNLALTQKTPLRVLHRRPLLARTREIYEMEAETVADHSNLFKLTLKTQAGTYVKEFIHGDFGRTTPSLSAILNDAQVDILALDVMSVDLEWPLKN